MLHQTNILKHGAVHNKMQASEDMGHARLRHRGRIVELSRKTISDNYSQRIASTHNGTHELQAQATGNRQQATGNRSTLYWPTDAACAVTHNARYFLSLVAH
jgi:hypothetical protein